MLRRLLLILIVLPLSLLVVALAVANRHSVALVLDPFSAAPEGFAVHVPLFLLLFATLILGVVLGGVAAWLRQGRYRRAARESRREARRTAAQAEELRARIGTLNREAAQVATTGLTTLPAPGAPAALPDRRTAA
ncbi:lipopolysaccharide assembly protein LapA domain-containing protein [Ancylobacter terrae]|uniref:lipopolysaccharide assembly protein LapA domain-containing protein n=1 Tax=Ancylobacter sp. sgz301288 TaxID=3342077 RepID=UPI00385975E0